MFCIVVYPNWDMLNLYAVSSVCLILRNSFHGSIFMLLCCGLAG